MDWRRRVNSLATWHHYILRKMLSGVFVEAAQGTLPQGYFLIYILQGFPDVLRDWPGCSDTRIGLEVCWFLQHLPVVGLTQGPRVGWGVRKEEFELVSSGWRRPYAPPTPLQRPQAWPAFARYKALSPDLALPHPRDPGGPGRASKGLKLPLSWGSTAAIGPTASTYLHVLPDLSVTGGGHCQEGEKAA